MSTNLYNPENARRQVLALSTQIGVLEEREYLIAWMQGVGGLTEQQADNARIDLNIPADRLESLQRRRSGFRFYIQPEVGGKN